MEYYPNVSEKMLFNGLGVKFFILVIVHQIQSQRSNAGVCDEVLLLFSLK